MDVGRDINTGEIVAVEINTDASPDAPRYRVVTPGPELIVERVPDNAAGDFYAAHWFDCPDANAGRTF